VQRSRNGRQAQTRYSANGAGVSNPRARQRALAIGVGASGEDGDPLAELKELLRTAGVATAGEAVQRREAPDPDRYVGRGKLNELKALIGACDANLVACDDELAPRQERNLEAALGVPVIDRTAVILDIFADHAHSAEGKLQVELAQLEYNLARMRGLWTHLERLGGGIGTRGPGESQIETDRRLARDRIAALRRRLNRLERNRGVMRARRERSSLPRIALAGYTNAGKSTLLNALTGSEVGVGDRLFHTLDPTTRSVELSGRDYLLTDTVGFIEKLPHQLVEAFKATLEETTLADLILHVVDAAAPEERRLADMRAVDEVLGEIGAGGKPRLLVLNKADLLGEEERSEALLRHPDAVLVSALSGGGLDDLRERIELAFEDTLAEVELLVPYSEGGRLHELHEIAGDLERTERSDGVLVRAKVPRAELHRFEDLKTITA
jgi:GTP-binding protein HflX